MSTRDLLDALSHALSHHATTTPPSVVQSAATTLYSLLFLDGGESYRPVIGSKRDIVYSLIEIVRSPKSSDLASSAEQIHRRRSRSGGSALFAGGEGRESGDCGGCDGGDCSDRRM
ncbi:hypothetical protein LINPERHAP1_LOCUS8566 [Linum perenne]